MALVGNAQLAPGDWLWSYWGIWIKIHHIYDKLNRLVEKKKNHYCNIRDLVNTMVVMSDYRSAWTCVISMFSSNWVTVFRWSPLYWQMKLGSEHWRCKDQVDALIQRQVQQRMEQSLRQWVHMRMNKTKWRSKRNEDQDLKKGLLTKLELMRRDILEDKHEEIHLRKERFHNGKFIKDFVWVLGNLRYLGS